MPSLSFDGLVDLYDETRTFDAGCFFAALDYLEERMPPSTASRVFEAGIGNGRIALPLAARGYRVTGVDISRQMLAVLARRLATVPAAPVAFAMGDVSALAFPAGCFDWAVAVHLFWFVADWQSAARELLRVVGPRGTVVLMSSGTGAEIPWLNARYKALCAEEGQQLANPGAGSTAEVLDYYRGLGCQVEQVLDRWCWSADIPYARALAHVAARAYSSTTMAPDAVHAAAVRRLEREVAALPGGLSGVAEVPNQIALTFVSPPQTAGGEG
jgi:ubiquinone/menaquinone biosynthesis C-methylase UbiE